RCIWREYKNYKNYLYAISDDGSPNSFQIIDMSFLPDSVHVVYDGTSLFERGHTLFIDGNNLYVGSVTEDANHGHYYSMAVYSLADPENPVLLRTLNQDDASIKQVHDMLVRNDTVYASCGNQGLFIYLFDQTANKFSPVSSIEFYPDKGYNHSSALTPDGHTLVFCDEIPKGLAVKIADVSDLHNISIDTTFRSAKGPTPHNPYIKDKNYVIIAYYQDGLQIFDISNPKSPVRTGYFDTDTIDGIANDYNPTGTAYHGNWGAYIHLPSGRILASDMQNGLYILDASSALNVSNHTQDVPSLLVYPNPAEYLVSLQFHLKKASLLKLEILDMTGRKLFHKEINEPAGDIKQTISMEAFDKGMYLIQLSSMDFSYSSKLIKK
ncbi:MAG TPA: choice-of-anchor B family protein, partial [Chitinophagales bacterium]|nr:choice-of-anchor B family protein [Chitinophagales bacterium]